MSTIEEIRNDWKKYAATSGQDADKGAVEKAFMDQAFTIVSNLARPLMQPPHRLGFEIVFKNDDNTRIAGVFAFRIGDDIQLVPVFFMNGTIKGGNMLYRTKLKKFLPLNEDWCRFLLENDGGEEGIPISRRKTIQIPQNLQLQKLQAPQTQWVSKSSATREEFLGWWADLVATEMIKPASFIGEFLDQDGGTGALEAIAGAMERDSTFASNFYNLVPLDKLAIRSTKSAAARTPDLVLHTGPINSSIKCASADYCVDGFWLEDFRKEATLSDVYEDGSFHQWTTPSVPGIYSVIMFGGKLEDYFCGRLIHRWEENRVRGDLEVIRAYGPDDRPTPERLVLTDGKCVNSRINKPLAEFKNAGEDRLLEKMEAGNGYVICDSASGGLTEPVWCRSARKEDGVTIYSVQAGYGREPIELRFNPDGDRTNFKKGMLGNRVRFVKCGGEWTGSSYSGPADSCAGGYACFKSDGIRVGTVEDVSAFLIGGGVKFASVVPMDDGPHVRMGDKTTDALSTKEATVFLAQHFGIAADTAVGLVKSAASRPVSFYFMPKGAAAGRPVQLQPEPTFDPIIDDRFNVLVDPQPKYEVPTDFYPEPTPAQRFGDAWDPSKGQLETDTPNQLASFAQQHDVPSVFEHGVVGELLKTYDAAGLVKDRYLPKLQEAVDCLGRILFLIYWKPQDFKQAYGSDDVSDKENELLSNFRSVGTLLLELMKQGKEDNGSSGNV